MLWIEPQPEQREQKEENVAAAMKRTEAPERSQSRGNEGTLGGARGRCEAPLEVEEPGWSGKWF